MTQAANTLQFYNTETKRKEPFTSIEPGHVRMYTCGPTVYDFAHIGNYRAYVFEDVLRRYLHYRGYRVTQVMNLTDVEDKIIRRAQEKGITIFEHTVPFIEAFFEDLDTLNIEQAEHYPRATDYIPQMLEIIRTLREKDYTYERDGSIYYRIAKFQSYGRLSGIRPDEVKSGARIDSDEYEKDDARDFVLWKGRKENEHFWESEFGPGRPGWHIECSAMSKEFLGDHFDIHTGGEDNIFPHHENEIAQSEAASGVKFVNYWLHCRHLLVDGEKMAKSKGNFFTLRDLIQRGHHPSAIRYFLVASHYRSPLNLSEEALKASHAAWTRIMDFHTRIVEIIQRKVDAPRVEALDAEWKKFVTQFETHMDDDLDTPRALASLFDFIKESNKILDANPIAQSQAKQLLDTLKRVDTVIGVIKEEEALLDEEIEQLIQLRQDARKQKKFALADKIRDELANQGIILEDTRDGVRWKRR
ncbi:MAG: cysteine--tRNA ligase [Candidatus Omnitrophota bacterium]|nr:MAG: cysteine--tRNA ligase [Candidatus Omnitrophota bacterium]